MKIEDIFDAVTNIPFKNKKCAIEKFVSTIFNGELEDENKKLVGRLWKQFERRWAAAQRNAEIFKRNNAVWLQSTINFCSSEEIDDNVVDKGKKNYCI